MLSRRRRTQRKVMPGVASEINEVQVEGTFPDGTKLVTINLPICKENGDLALALQVCVCRKYVKICA